MMNLRYFFLSCLVASVSAKTLAVRNAVTKRDGVSTNATCPGDDGEQYTDPSGYVFQIYCEQTLDAGPYDIMAITNPDFTTLAACIAVCGTYNQNGPPELCAGVLWLDNTCYLKAVGETVNYGGDQHYLAMVVSAPNPVTITGVSTAASCTADDKLLYTDSYNASYQLYCNYNGNPGAGDLTNSFTASNADCAQYCTQYNLDKNPGPPCVFAVRTHGGQCYLKSNNGGNVNLNSDGSSDLLYLDHNTTSASAVATGSGVYCPKDAGTTYSDPYGYQYQLSCGNIDYSIGSLDILNYAPVTSLTDCLEICSNYNRAGPSKTCTAAVINGNTCYLKYGAVTSQGGNNAGAGLIVGSPSPVPYTGSSTSANCNADNGQSYTDAYGATYDLFCTANGNPGYDINRVEVDSLAACAASCSEYNYNNPNSQKCDFVVKYKYNGDCYLKFGQGNDPTNNPQNVLFQDNNFDSAIQMSPPTHAPPASSTSSALPSITSAPAAAATCPATFGSTYTSPEGDSYAPGIIYASNVTQLLESSIQASSCDCVEQCSIFNRANPAPPVPCGGVEYYPSRTQTVNCLIKSN